MSEVWYVVAFVLMAIGASVGDKVDRGPVIDRPLNPVPLRVVTGVTGLAGIGWLVFGFFPFSWWLPFLALIAFTSLGALITVYSTRSRHAPLISIISSFLGLAIAVIVLLTHR